MKSELIASDYPAATEKIEDEKTSKSDAVALRNGEKSALKIEVKDSMVPVTPDWSMFVKQ